MTDNKDILTVMLNRIEYCNKIVAPKIINEQISPFNKDPNFFVSLQV